MIVGLADRIMSLPDICRRDCPGLEELTPSGGRQGDDAGDQEKECSFHEIGPECRAFMDNDYATKAIDFKWISAIPYTPERPHSTSCEITLAQSHS
jgi:hypothetical protein